MNGRLIENDKIAQLMPDQTQLTTWYTERAVKFIEKNREKPFFLYLAHSMPHVPLFVSDKFKGKTKKGLYGDVIEEIDWSVGRALETLKRLQLDNGRNSLSSIWKRTLEKRRVSPAKILT